MNTSTYEKQCNKLFEMCLDVVTPKINSYVGYLEHLPEYVKFRILIRVTKLKYGIQDDIVMKSLIQPGLRMLNLSTSTITDESLNILSQCKLMNRLTLNKANYQMTSKGLISLFPNLRYLRALYIACCKVMTDEVLKCLKDECHQVSELDLGSCNITDKGMQSLSQMSALSSLNISHTKVTNIGLKYLVNGACKKSLCEIRMSGCPITDIGVNALASNCPLLSTLICNDCDIKDMASTFQAWKLPMKQLSWTINFDSPPLF